MPRRGTSPTRPRRPRASVRNPCSFLPLCEGTNEGWLTQGRETDCQYANGDEFASTYGWDFANRGRDIGIFVVFVLVRAPSSPLSPSEEQVLTSRARATTVQLRRDGRCVKVAAVQQAVATPPSPGMSLDHSQRVESPFSSHRILAAVSSRSSLTSPHPWPCSPVAREKATRASQTGSCLATQPERGSAQAPSETSRRGPVRCCWSGGPDSRVPEREGAQVDDGSCAACKVRGTLSCSDTYVHRYSVDTSLTTPPRLAPPVALTTTSRPFSRHPLPPDSARRG